MKSAHFYKNPILIIDKAGLIGDPLSSKLSKEFPVVLVSERALETEGENRKILHVPFLRKFPTIPDNKYSQIILIDNEEVDEFLPKIIDKSKEVNADFIFAQTISSRRQHIFKKVFSLSPSAKVILYGDIFDNKLIYQSERFESVVNKFIYQAQRFGRMQVLAEGLVRTYPVFLGDVVDGLIDIIFGINKSNSLFYIFPKHPVTELSLAHMIQKANPEIIIDFIRHGLKVGDISFLPNGKYLLEDKYPLAKKIRKIDIKTKVKGDENRGSKKNDKRLKNFPFFLIWLLILLLFSPFISTLIFSLLGMSALYYSEKEINKGNTAIVRSALNLSRTFFYIGKKSSEVLYAQAKIVGRQNNLERLSQDIDFGYKISQGLIHAFDSEEYFLKVFGGKSKNPAEDFAKGQGNLKGAIVALEKLKAEEKIPAPILEKLNSIEPLVKLFSNVSDIMPILFGLDKQKKYLILFQNNMELRPAGGLVDHFGILKINRGKIEDFSIRDINDADGQLRGHVEPPFAIRRYLPSAHWYMKDSSFDVDFARSASSSSNFIFVEKGEKVDGVIGMDLSFIKNILQAIGPVYVSDYKKTIDGNNFYIETQSQKKDFLRSVYEEILNKISTKNISYLQLARAISDSVSRKHLLFAFNNSFQNTLAVNGWSSSLWDDRKNGEETINDFLGINEANLGANRVNPFIRRNIAQKVLIEDSGSVSEELTIGYLNESSSGEDYKNYLRIILPRGTVLSEILINDISQKIIDAITDPLIYEEKNFKAPLGLEVEKTQRENKSIYGFVLNVPAGKIVKVKLRYYLAGNVLDLNNFSYSLKLFKQPGVDDLPYSFSLKYPAGLNIIENKGFKKENEKLSYSEAIKADQELKVFFGKK